MYISAHSFNFICTHTYIYIYIYIYTIWILAGPNFFLHRECQGAGPKTRIGLMGGFWHSFPFRRVFQPAGFYKKRPKKGPTAQKQLRRQSFWKKSCKILISQKAGLEFNRGVLLYMWRAEHDSASPSRCGFECLLQFLELGLVDKAWVQWRLRQEFCWMSTLWSFQLNGYCDCLVSHGFPMRELVTVACGIVSML